VNKNLTAKEFMILQAKHKWNIVELNKEYWITEWSWTPICDGIYPYQEILRHVQLFNFFDKATENVGRFDYFCPVYQTTKNNRFYFPWEIFDSKQDAKIASRIYDSWGYDYDCNRKTVLKKIIELSGTPFDDKSINGII
jgi:hypothetical protein